ncbi:MAG: 2-hydroxyacyl-CoA dehydratase [Chloroflexi bacterium]|nr:2-hydroxyacyl-CoA dehydratase [Chloroflexota bacterium]
MEKKVNRVRTTALVKDMVTAYYDDLRKARQTGRKVAWACGVVPFELLRVMDIAFEHGESYGAYSAARGGNIELKQAAEAEGYSADACSYWRTLNGLAILARKGAAIREDMALPLPDFVVGANHCQTVGLWTDSLSRLLNVPGFVIDVPMTYYESEYEKNIAHLEAQLRAFITFLEGITGKQFDFDRLKEVMRLVKKAAALRRECLDLCKSIPTPMSYFDCLIGLRPMHSMRGTSISVDYYEKLKAEIEDRVARKIGVIPNEQYRLYWDNLPIWFKVGAISEKLAALNAVPIVSTYTHGAFYYEADKIDPERPLRSIAEELVFICRDMNARFKVERIARWVEEYSLDGLIMHSARTCRPVDIGQYDIIDEMRRRYGIPGVVIEADPTDPLYYSDTDVDQRLESFVEIMRSRKQ